MWIVIIATICVVSFILLVVAMYFECFFNNFKGDEKNRTLLTGRQYDKYRMVMQKLCANADRFKVDEDIYITSYDGKRLHASFYMSKPNAPVCIMFHGYKGSATHDFSGGIPEMKKKEFNIIAVDMRGHGKSDGRTISFGEKEKYDVISWADYAYKRFGAGVPIFLYGISMGASTVLMASELNIAPTVVGIIADCPFSSGYEIIRKVVRTDMHMLFEPYYPFIWIAGKLFGKFNIHATSAVNTVKNTKVPILIIHGKDDRFVPFEMSKRIYNANKRMIYFLPVENAPHGLSYIENYKLYMSTVNDFINTRLEKFYLN